MDRAVQVELARRILRAHAEGDRSPDAPAAAANPVREYTDPQRLALECERLFRPLPIFAGLSADLPGPATFCTLDVAGLPVLLLRDRAGVLRAFQNVCRHRGAPVLEGRGALPRRLVCPYHGWSYESDGALAARPAEWAFEGVPRGERGLIALPVAEHLGMLWVRPAPGASIDTAALLGGAERELAGFGLADHHRFDSRELRQRMNWKLVVDTFMEQYHLPALHRDSLAPMFLGTLALYDAFGDHGRLAAVRRSLLELEGRPESEWCLLPHTTLLYFLFPNVVFIHQQDHVQVWQVYPDGAPDAARMVLTLYVPEAPASERAREHFRRHMELLVDVTTGEDFTLGERIQRGYRHAAQESVVFGRNEVALAHYHRALRARLGEAREGGAVRSLSPH